MPIADRAKKSTPITAAKGGNMFTQTVDPIGNLGLTCLVALIPVVFLLVLLAVFRVSAWLAVLLGSIVTFVLAAWVWHMPLDTGMRAYFYGSATGVWNVDWITFWGLMLFNTLGLTGLFENFRRWLISQGTLDIRVQTMLFAWAFGALLEGLVGFGYPWAVVAPILISLGLRTSMQSESPPSPTTRRCPMERSARRSSRWPRSPAIRCWRCPARSAASSPSWRCCRPGC